MQKGLVHRINFLHKIHSEDDEVMRVKQSAERKDMIAEAIGIEKDDDEKLLTIVYVLLVIKMMDEEFYNDVFEEVKLLEQVHRKDIDELRPELSNMLDIEEMIMKKQEEIRRTKGDFFE